MAIKSNRPYSEISQRIEAVKSAVGTSFRELLEAGGFDPKNDLRYQNLSGLSFTGEDLRGIDFTGANIIGCDFKGALISTARFDQARVGNIFKGSSDDATGSHILSEAADWPAHVAGWVLKDPGFEVTEGETHLAAGDLFYDSPVLPIMVVLPVVPPRPAGVFPRMAMSFGPVNKLERATIGKSAVAITELHGGARRHEAAMVDDSFTWSEAEAYSERAGRVAHRLYSLPDREDWEFLDRHEVRQRMDRIRSFGPFLTWFRDDRDGVLRRPEGVLRRPDRGAEARNQVGCVVLVRRLLEQGGTLG